MEIKKFRCDFCPLYFCEGFTRLALRLAEMCPLTDTLKRDVIFDSDLCSECYENLTVSELADRFSALQKERKPPKDKPSGA